MVGINEELEAAEAAKAALSAINPNSQATIRILRQAKYIAALAMTTLPSDKPLNDARHAVVITLSDLVHTLETDLAPHLRPVPTGCSSRCQRARLPANRHLWAAFSL